MIYYTVGWWICCQQRMSRHSDCEEQLPQLPGHSGSATHRTTAFDIKGRPDATMSEISSAMCTPDGECSLTKCRRRGRSELRLALPVLRDRGGNGSEVWGSYRPLAPPHSSRLHSSQRLAPLWQRHVPESRWHA